MASIAVKEGRPINAPIDGYQQQRVLPACDLTDGHHYCITHDEHFPNNLTANGHAEDRGRHVMGWVCHAHGIEAAS